MCECKEKVSDPKEPAKTIAKIEGGNVIAGQREASKGSEYFESALAETKFGKFNYFLIIVSGLILSNVLLETLSMSFVLPVSQCDLQLTIQQRGILSAIGFAGIITSSHWWGFLADTTGRRNIMRPTLLIGFVVTFMSSFANTFWLLVVLRFINGFCVSGGSATVYAYLGEFHTTKNRSRAIMGAAFIFGVGAMMLPALAWLVINQDWRVIIPILNITYKPWRLFMVVCGVPGLICGLCLFAIPESPKFLLSQGNKDKTLKILQNIFHSNTGKSREEYPITNVLEDLESARRPKVDAVKTNPAAALLSSMWSQTQPLFNREHMRTTLLICTIQFWIFVTSNGMYMWFPHILNSVAEFMKENPGNRTYICDVVYAKHASTFEMDYDATVEANQTATVGECNEKLETSTYHHSLVLEVLYAVGFAVIGIIINNVEKMAILFVCLAVCGACGVVVVYIDIPMIAIYVYVILLCCGLGINVLSAATVDLYPTQLRAMAICISLMMGRLGSVVGANITGILIVNHCEAAFLASGISLIISGFLGFLVPKRQKGSEPTLRRASIVSMTGN